jgi:hypothetical protein
LLLSTVLQFVYHALPCSSQTQPSLKFGDKDQQAGSGVTDPGVADSGVAVKVDEDREDMKVRR